MTNYKHIQAFKYKEISKDTDSRILGDIGIWVFGYHYTINNEYRST